MNNAKTTADEVEIARQPSLAPLLIVQTKAGKLTPFNLLPVALANAALGVAVARRGRRSTHCGLSEWEIIQQQPIVFT